MKKNKNNCDVVVKKDRICVYCGKTIKKGTLCRTVNNRNYGRNWFCNEKCLSYLEFEIEKYNLLYEIEDW